MNVKLIIDRVNIMLDVDDIASLRLFHNGFFYLSITKTHGRREDKTFLD